ncbi:HNH endonuclease, partial [Halorubrum sp. Atlit-26R]|uniref:HNH endonuclease n=1 Tax=Halorubrum sp. Atlit-26R TaxID=2282128 RepID=UPI000F18AB0A
DEPENILVLCPNHHTDFDYGQLTVDPETYRVSHTYEEAVDGTELDIADPHMISEDHLTYHNEVIAGE